MPGKRNQLDLLAEVILAAKNGGTKTQISYQAKMYFRLSSKYFNLALEKGYLSNNGAALNVGNSTYKATPKGLEFVEAYTKLKALK